MSTPVVGTSGADSSTSTPAPTTPTPTPSPSSLVTDQSFEKMWATTKALLSGGIAGAVSRTVTSPLERLKVMRQVQTTGNAYGGMLSAFTRMYREEGLRSYWKGNGANVMRIAPYSAVQFLAFDQYKHLLMPNGSNSEYHVALRFIAGGLSGATSAFLCYPLDLVRSHLTVQTTVRHYNGMWDGMRTIARTDGFLGLYRGLVPTLFGIAPYNAINFSVFDVLKRHFLPQKSDPWFDAINFSLGAAAGTTAALITYPTDVLRRRMQLSGMKIEAVNLPTYRNSWHCIQHTVATEGVRGMYKGMIPCVMKVAPSMAISFALHERLRSWLAFDLKKPV
jgi:solute carrier family 25 phosphate transporter 23/24/25/41